MRALPLPAGVPRTKPRAMGIGLRYAGGTLRDASMTLRTSRTRSAEEGCLGLPARGRLVACLQAKLGYYNPRQNLLTRWFTLEYDAWFNIFLPGLHRIGAPIPLGGTSNHFRPKSLEACHAWDPYNVTEDADLGLRFARLGPDDGDARIDHVRGGEQPGRQLAAPALALDQGLHADAPGPHPAAAAAAAGARPEGHGRASCSRSAAPSSPRCSPRCSGCCSSSGSSCSRTWIAALFPGPIYYAASVSLVAGNFAARVPQPRRRRRAAATTTSRRMRC